MSEWIEWKGIGEPDIPRLSLIDIKLRGGEEDEEFPHSYYKSRFPSLWEHSGSRKDIIAYRLSKANGDKDE